MRVNSELYSFLYSFFQWGFLTLIGMILIPISPILVSAVLFVIAAIFSIKINEQKLFRDVFAFKEVKKRHVGLLFIINILGSLSFIQMLQFSSFISTVIAYVIVAFLVFSNIIVLKLKGTFYAKLRLAFFYTLSFFYLTMLPLLFFSYFTSVSLGKISFITFFLVTTVAIQFYFKINHEYLSKLLENK